MNPIPTWVRKLWDAWDLRALVLLSFTLQIILSIFGDRRKYISSVWINVVLVWSAYLMADWVATVALGKLSDAEGNLEKTNQLWAVWAPLLLLHLGGPNSITAYSLEDNQLWMRHLMGLVVQISVAIYVILMSWKDSWFSFMSLPALVAGIIKYGERTWVLKLVNDENYLHRRPFGSLRDKYSTEGHDYVQVLVVAYEHLGRFMGYLVDGGLVLGAAVEDWGNLEDHILRDALEVKMGLMYDLLYTKADVIYSKGGFIMRCISFGCTATVLTLQIVLLKGRGENDIGRVEENWYEIDIAITVLLTVGAVAMEIYAAIEIFSSNWMMLWLIQQGREEWVIWLSKKFPFLFNKKKSFSQMMGKFDLLGYCLKHTGPATDLQSPRRKIIRTVLGDQYEDLWDKYRHKTTCSVLPSVYNAILEFCHKPNNDMSISDSLTHELDEIWEIVGYPNMPGSFLKLVKELHLATEICYHLETEWDAGGEDDPSGSDSSRNRETSKALSDYMMYLLIMHPSLLPNVGILFPLEVLLFNPRGLIGNEREVNEACKYLLTREEAHRMIAEQLKGKEKRKRWEIIKRMWLRTLHAAAHGPNGLGQKDSHFQKLRQGGELLTLIWFINPISRPRDEPFGGPPMGPMGPMRPPPMRSPRGPMGPPMGQIGLPMGPPMRAPMREPYSIREESFLGESMDA